MNAKQAIPCAAYRKMGIHQLRAGTVPTPSTDAMAHLGQGRINVDLLRYADPNASEIGIVNVEVAK
jgi:hypothetical protein